MSITNNLITVFRLLIGMAISIYMAGLDCHPGQMASNFTSRIGNSIIKVHDFYIRCDEALMGVTGGTQKSTRHRQISSTTTGNSTDIASGHSTKLSMNVNPKTGNRQIKSFGQIAAYILC